MAEEASAISALFGDPVQENTGEQTTPETDTGTTEDPALARPDWLPEKFKWSPEDRMSSFKALASSYGELEKKLGERSKADNADPASEKVEDYLANLTIEDLKKVAPKISWKDVDADNPEILAMTNALMNEGVGTKKAAQIATRYFTDLSNGMPDPEGVQERRARVVNEIGSNGERVMGEVSHWLTSQHEKGRLTNDDIKALAPLAQSAAGVRALHKMRGASLSSAPPSSELALERVSAIKDASAELKNAFVSATDEEWAANKDALISRYNQIQQAYGKPLEW